MSRFLRLLTIVAFSYVAWRVVRVILVMLVFAGALPGWWPDWALPDSV